MESKGKIVKALKCKTNNVTKQENKKKKKESGVCGKWLNVK